MVVDMATAASRNLLAISLARQAARTGDGRRLRESMELSLREASSALGVNPATLSRWERALHQPKGQRAVRYGDMLTSWLAASMGEAEA